MVAVPGSGSGCVGGGEVEVLSKRVELVEEVWRGEGNYCGAWLR